MGAGMVWADYALTVLLALAALSDLAVIRHERIHEARIAEAFRWVGAAAFGAASVRFGFLLYTDGDVPVSPVMLISLALICARTIGLGAVVLCDRRKRIAPDSAVQDRFERRRSAADRRVAWRPAAADRRKVKK